MLKDSKDSVNESSTLSLVKSADLYYSKNLGNNDINETFNGKTNLLDNLSISGKKPDSGFVLLDEDGNVSVGAVFDNVCYVKQFDEEEAKKSDISDCEFVGPNYITNMVKEDENIIETINYLGNKD